MKESVEIYNLVSRLSSWPTDSKSLIVIDAPAGCKWSETEEGVVLLLDGQEDLAVTKKDWQRCVSMKIMSNQRRSANPDRDNV